MAIGKAETDPATLYQEARARDDALAAGTIAGMAGLVVGCRVVIDHSKDVSRSYEQELSVHPNAPLPSQWNGTESTVIVAGSAFGAGIIAALGVYYGRKSARYIFEKASFRVD